MKCPIDLADVAYVGETEVPSRGTCDACGGDGRRKSAFARGGGFLGMVCESCRGIVDTIKGRGKIRP